MGFLGRFMKGRALTPADAAAAVEQGTIVLVDVREKHEFAAGHCPGARHVPLGRLDNAAIQRLAALDRPVAFVCQSGMRSARATRQARAAGLEAQNVRGGMAAWQRERLPLSKGRGRRK